LALCSCEVAFGSGLFEVGAEFGRFILRCCDGAARLGGCGVRLGHCVFGLGDCDERVTSWHGIAAAAAAA
jgi:hypothetical protein